MYFLVNLFNFLILRFCNRHEVRVCTMHIDKNRCNRTINGEFGNRTTGLHKRSQGWVQRATAPSKFSKHIVILCFERRYPKQNSGIYLKSDILAPPKYLGWLRYCRVTDTCSLTCNTWYNTTSRVGYWVQPWSRPGKVRKYCGPHTPSNKH